MWGQGPSWKPRLGGIPGGRGRGALGSEIPQRHRGKSASLGAGDAQPGEGPVPAGGGLPGRLSILVAGRPSGQWSCKNDFAREPVTHPTLRLRGPTRGPRPSDVGAALGGQRRQQGARTGDVSTRGHRGRGARSEPRRWSQSEVSGQVLGGAPELGVDGFPSRLPLDGLAARHPPGTGRAQASALGLHRRSRWGCWEVPWGLRSLRPREEVAAPGGPRASVEPAGEGRRRLNVSFVAGPFCPPSPTAFAPGFLAFQVRSWKLTAIFDMGGPYLAKDSHLFFLFF